MRDAIHRRRWRDDEGGMSLVEIMIAIFVLSVGLLALASTAITSIIDLRVSRGRQEATDAASALIEDLRRSDFSRIALDETDPTTSDYITDSGGCDEDFDEPLVTTSQPGGLVREQAFGPSGLVTLSTSVSWYDEDDAHVCGDNDHAKRVKRVRVVAEWTDADRTFSLEESTMVAAVDRGLPAPDFRLSPDTGSLNFTVEDVSSTREKCVPHLLRNLGAEDGYDWVPEKLEGSKDNSATKAGPTYFHTATNRWTVRTFLEFPPAESPTNPADSDNPDGLDHVELLEDRDENGRPETAPETRLSAGDDAILWVCYQVGSDLTVGDYAIFDVHVRSLFDENRVETVTHTARVTETVMDLFLYDDNETLEGSDGPRVVGSDGNAHLPTLRMGPESDGQPEQLGTAASLPDYDTDLDPNGLAGTRLAATTDYPSANEIIFHEQVTSDTSFDPSVDLSYYTASESALLGDEWTNEDGDAADPTLRYRIELELLNSNENENQATTIQINGADAYDYAYLHNGSGWMLFDETLTINGGSPLAVSEGQYLRLTITCLDTSDDVCHLGYDHVNYRSALRLVALS